MNIIVYIDTCFFIMYCNSNDTKIITCISF